MHGPASLWMIEAFVAATAVAAALFGLVIAAVLLLGRRVELPVNRRRRRAVKWGLVLSLLPLGWLLFGDGLFLWDGFLTGLSWPVRMLVTGLSGLGIGCSGGLVFGYLFDLVDEPDFVRPQPGEVIGGRSAGQGAPPKRAPAGAVRGAPPLPPQPVLRPAQGAVTAAAPGRNEDEERAALLRTLQEGPDFRRAAAATALALSCAGSRAPQVIEALLTALRDENFGALVRVESLLALYRVCGKSLAFEVESEVRQDFPAGVDWEFVRSCESRLEGGES